MADDAVCDRRIISRPGGLMRHYPGCELELFAAALNWKRYLARALLPFVAGSVLEVGAGIGGNIPYLCNSRVKAWTGLEPDPQLARSAAERVAKSRLPVPCTIVVGTIDNVASRSRFDTILYIDVLEHIADDAVELARAATHLMPGGRLVVLAPAHQFLFSAFDAAIGHFRRYDRASLAALAPPGCRPQALFMLDSAGFSASLMNVLLLHTAQPSQRQIRFWDRFLVPVSRILDPATGCRFGKTVVAVWRLIF
jgi:SAM-dependent methyltransferase